MELIVSRLRSCEICLHALLLRFRRCHCFLQPLHHAHELLHGRLFTPGTCRSGGHGFLETLLAYLGFENWNWKTCVVGLMFYICPTWAPMFPPVDKVVFVHGLSSRAMAPSFRSVCKYLKRSEQRGALAAVCNLTIKSASKKHQKVTDLRIGTPWKDALKVVKILNSWYCVALIALCSQWVRSENN